MLGPTAQVWLFGSRVDDHARGGDIDLFIELPQPIDNPSWQILRLNGALQQQFGAQKIDIIVHTAGQPTLPVHREAKTTGMRL